MTTLLFVLFFLFAFSVGIAATLLVVGLIVREDVKNGEGVYVSYNAREDKWMVFGDIDATINKMYSHYKRPDVYDKAKLEELEKANKNEKQKRWYRK